MDYLAGGSLQIRCRRMGRSGRVQPHPNEIMATQSFQIRVEGALYAKGVAPESQMLVGPIDLEINGGEFLAIVGPPASGKTTLLKMIAGILKPTSGNIRICGAKTQPPGRDFGLLLEDPALLPWRSAMQNILLQAEMAGLELQESRNRARRLLAWLGLSHYEASKPHELPPGTMGAIALCRALIHSPSLLLMDEPFRDLDPLALEQRLDGFQRLWAEAGNTAALFTRNMQEAVLLADRVVVLSPRPGRILEHISIELPRPRRFDKATTLAIAEYCYRIRTIFRAQGVLP